MKNVKNLRINGQRVKVLIGAIILVPTLVGCSARNNSESEKQTYVVTESVLNNKVQYLVINVNETEKIVPVETLKLVNSKNEVIDSVDGVVVGKQIMAIDNPVDILFTTEISKVIINNEMLPVSEFSLINGETKEKVTNIVGMYVNYNFVDLSDNPLFNDNRLTDEKFYELVDRIYIKYSEIGLDVSREDVIDQIMFANIDKLATDNKELINTIIGDREFDAAYANSADVRSAIMTENNYRYCSKGLGWDSLILVSDMIFDKEEKKVVENIESRIKEVVESKNNKAEFNELFGKLLDDMLMATNKEFNMESGSGYNVMMILVNFVRINFQNLLNAENAEKVKYFVNFATDAVEYQENSRATAYYRGIYNILTDCPVKTKTR